MKSPLVYISLLNWQKYEDCISCVRSLEKLDYLNYKILIRDNKSPNDSVSQLQKALPKHQISCNNTNDGYAAGHLENWKIAKKNGADFFWILNCDVTLFSDTLSTLISLAKKEKNTILGSLSLESNNTDIIDFGGGNLIGTQQNPISYNTWKGKLYTNYLKLYPNHREVQSLAGSSILIPSKIIESNGFMKTDFFMYGEETDYCISLKKKGVRSILVSRSKIIHHSASSFKSSIDLSYIPAYYRRRNYLRIMKEHFDWSAFKVLTHKNSLWNNMKFLFTSRFLPSFREDKIGFYLLLGTWHAFLNKNKKTIQPEKHC